MTEFQFNSETSAPQSDIRFEAEPGLRPHWPNDSTDPTDFEDNFEPLIIDAIPFPRVASRRIRAMDVNTRARWNADRLRCKTDQLFLSDVLGLDLVENPHCVIFNSFLKKRPGVQLSELDLVVKRRMTLYPRGHGKTVCNAAAQP